jgi:class 3 adenylate cyclase
VAARVAAKAGPGQVLVTSAVVEGTQGAGLMFRPVGSFELKGVTRQVDLHQAVPGADLERAEGTGSVTGRAGSVL